MIGPSGSSIGEASSKPEGVHGKTAPFENAIRVAAAATVLLVGASLIFMIATGG
ncbi:hypothetical protein [Rhizobium halophilum]|uniref:hypothetical protein n=1 Tax=Rhizobium halophilum TaxID=2846852 RepID=UPI001EFD6AC2|nr:hypothetical protein [Rhizobium halophilum]MCF6369621.1 hypothetical protein [Rhizobium halophilum]